MMVFGVHGLFFGEEVRSNGQALTVLNNIRGVGFVRCWAGSLKWGGLWIGWCFYYFD